MSTELHGRTFGTYKDSRLALRENVATADLTRLTAEDFHLA